MASRRGLAGVERGGARLQHQSGARASARVGPAFKPDLVVVGFFPNDLVDNYTVVPAGRPAIAVSAVTSFLRRHVYSLELYKHVFLTLGWKLSGSDEFQKRLDHLGTEDQLPASRSRSPI